MSNEHVFVKRKEKTNFKTVICSGEEMEHLFEVFKNRKDIRIVSRSSISVFRQQADKYKTSIVPNKLKAAYIEISNDRSAYEFAYKVISIRDNIY